MIGRQNHEICGLRRALSDLFRVSDILTCKPEAMWSLVKRCDFSGSLRGGKCVYPSKVAYRFATSAGVIAVNRRELENLKIHKTRGL